VDGLAEVAEHEQTIRVRELRVPRSVELAHGDRDPAALDHRAPDLDRVARRRARARGDQDVLLVADVRHARRGAWRLEVLQRCEPVGERACVAVPPEVDVREPAGDERSDQHDDADADHVNSDAASAMPLNAAWATIPGSVLSWR